MINADNIRNILDEGSKAGHQIIVRDISYVLLCRMYEEKDLAYKSLFPEQDDFKTYSEQPKIKWLQKFMSESIFDDNESSITFDENKRAMLSLIDDIVKQRNNKNVKEEDKLKLLKAEADLRVKLNDKFKIQAEVKEKVVVVEKKYNHICKKFGVECYLPTKEDLMEMYNLVEKQ
ncbi:MAG: hypothetical protein II604_03330 [Bacteroidales bacterium]|nr:hypothetical protein [Bacteroidales bacterium]